MTAFAALAPLRPHARPCLPPLVTAPPLGPQPRLRQAHMRIHKTRWKSLVLALSVHDWVLSLLAAVLLGVFRWSARKP